MAMKELGELVTELLIVVQALTGYGAPASAPDVAFVPAAEIQEAACSGPCQVYGWFPPGKTIYLDDRLDPLNDLRARGILVHELVHYLQEEHAAFGDGAPCWNWARREREAYLVQGRWLARQATTTLMTMGFGPPPWTLACRDAPEEAPSLTAIDGGG